MKKKYLILFVILNIFSVNVFGQTDSLDIFDMSFEELLKINVYSASKQIEPLREVPVPVTVITEELIKNSSATNLKELLIMYVPGFDNVQDHNEMNFAVRGVYASSQQKVLILLDGHRLNSRAYSSANPDFSISLEKIKQIEILRGPASSLYGNVALTSVINIITKSGADLNGSEISVTGGNFGQKKLSYLYGTETGNSDFLIWANIYKADGEKVFIDSTSDYSSNPHSGYAIIGGCKGKPSFDLGFKNTIKDITFSLNIRNGKIIEPFTGSGITGEVYNYDEYRTFLGISPGLGSLSAHLNFDINKTINDKFEFTSNIYADHNAIEISFATVPQDTGISILLWKEIDFGQISQLKMKYKLGQLGDGNVIAGTQIDYMNLYDSFNATGKGGEITTVMDKKDNTILQKGYEITYSGFMQIKHNFTNKFILNFGLRYDLKDRHNGKNIHNTSPRLALIYFPNNFIDFKLSYSNSFVDAPYWYRYNSFASYKGSENLLPEHLNSIQFTTFLHFHNNKFRFQINEFYNNLTDFIYRDLDATGDQPRYRNAGRLESYGEEFEFYYVTKSLVLNTNFTYQYVLSASDYYVKDNEIYNIPQFHANLSITYNPFYEHDKKVIFNLNASYLSEQLSPINQTFLGGEPFISLDNKIEQYFLLNAVIRFEGFRGFGLKAQCSNILNTKYYAGGSVRFPYPQQGRWYSLTLSYFIDNKTE